MECFRWNNGPYSGAFKRLMTVRPSCLPSSHGSWTYRQYTYLLTLPLVLVYALGNTIIKYHQGFIDHPIYGSTYLLQSLKNYSHCLHTVVAKPYQMWSPAAQNANFPLMLCFSIAWGLEMWASLTSPSVVINLIYNRITHLEGWRFRTCQLNLTNTFPRTLFLVVLDQRQLFPAGLVQKSVFQGLGNWIFDSHYLCALDYHLHTRRPD